MKWETKGVNIYGKLHTRIRISDNIIWISETVEDLGNILFAHEREGLKVILQMEKATTKLMFGSQCIFFFVVVIKAADEQAAIMKFIISH